MLIYKNIFWWSDEIWALKTPFFQRKFKKKLLKENFPTLKIEIPFLCDLDYLNLSPAGWYFPNLLWSFLAKVLFRYYFFQLISYLFGLGLVYLFVI